MNNDYGNSGDELFKNLFGQGYTIKTALEHQKKENELGKKHDPDFVEKPDDEHAKRLLFLITIAIIALIGVEPTKVLLRKNFGMGSISAGRLTLCCLLFFGFGLCAFVIAGSLMISEKKDDKDFFGDGPVSFLVTGVFYLWLAVHSFRKGRLEMERTKHNNVPYGYSGDSELLKVYIKSGLSSMATKGFLEPVFVILAGLIFSLCINIIGGLPIMACGLSLWVDAILRMVFLTNAKDKIMRNNAELDDDETFNDSENEI